MFEHDSDLLVAAFDQFDFVPGVVAAPDHFDGGWRGAAAAERNACAETLLFIRSERSVDFDQIGFRNVALGSGDGVGEFAIVGEQDEAVAVIIEAAGRG